MSVGELEPRPSRLDAVLSTQMNECSIAAANANRLTLELLAGKTHKARAYVVDGLMEPRLSPLDRIIHMGEVGLRSNVTHRNSAQVYLDGGLTRDSSDAIHPRLLAIINDDIAIPFVGFEKRREGQCSYVQLGQEMTEDSLVVGNNDPRKDYVEAVRALLSHSKTDESEALITKLIHQEIDKHHDEVELLLAPSLARAVAIRFAAMDRQARDVIVLPTSSLEPAVSSTMEVAQIIETTPLKKYDVPDRTIELVFAQDSTGAKTKKNKFLRRITPIAPEQSSVTSLMAITRNRLAIPIADFTNKGAVTLTTVDQMTNESSIKDADTRELYSLRQLMDGTNRREEDKKAIEGVTSKIDGYGYKQYYKNCEILYNGALLESRASRSKDELEDSALYDFKRYEIGAKFDAALGEFEPTTETLINKLGNLATKDQTEYRGVLPKQKIGTTFSDVGVAVEILTPNPDSLGVKISGAAILDNEAPVIVSRSLTKDST